MLVQQNQATTFGVYMGTAGLTLTITLRKAGGSFQSVAPSVNDHTNGWYTITPSTSHRDTLGVNNWLFVGGGTSMPYAERVVAFNPDAVAVGANTTVPDNAGIAAAQASAATAATQSATAATQATNAATSAASADGKLTAGRLSRLDRLPDIVAGLTGGLALVGSEVTLSSANLAALFADADIPGLLASFQAIFDEATDVPIQTLAAQAAIATVNAFLANGSILTLLADAAAAKVAAQAVNTRLPATPASQGDVTGATSTLATAIATVGTAAAAAKTAAEAVDTRLPATPASQADVEGATDTIVGAIEPIDAVATKLAAMIETNTGQHRFTAYALGLAPAGGGGGTVDTEQIVSGILLGLGGVTVSIVSPYVEATQQLTLVQRSDYSVSNARPLRFRIAEAPGVSEGDTARFGATMGGSRIFATGTVVAISDVLYAQFELSATTHLNVTAGKGWRWELETLNDDGKITPLIVDAPLTIKPSRADPAT